MTDLSKAFDDVIETIEGGLPLPGEAEIPSEHAYRAFEDAITQTVLPRRLTVRTEHGARLSVVAKNHRVIKLTEVHPPELWIGGGAPEEAECQSDYDSFGQPFANALVGVTDHKAIRIEQALLSDPVNTTSSGYSAAALGGHIEQSQKRAPTGEKVIAFFEESDGLPRARFGKEIEITIPNDSTISHDWMQARIDDVQKNLEGSEASIRLYRLEGETPQALALVWLDGEGSIALCTNQKQCSDVEQRLTALRQYL